MSRRRVVVTGLGAITPIGNSADELWSNALKGKSGVAPIQSFDTTGQRVHIGAEVKDFDPSQYMEEREARRYDPFIQIGVAAAAQAIEQAGLAHSPDLDRVGVAIGSGIGGIQTISEQHEVVITRGPRRVTPFFVPSSIVNLIAGKVSIDYGFAGPNIAIVTACTTGTHNIGFGFRTIQHGEADAMVVGGSEWSTSPLTIAGFASMKALSTRVDDPESASRPWDKGRDGFVLGDGAGVIVLESYEHAMGRGAEVLAEVSGFGMSADAHHITSPPEDGKGAITSMKLALQDADVAPKEIDYINAHGTSTPLGDVAETRSIKAVFGDDTRVPISSTKSMFGHLLGAAGSVEAIVSIMSLKDQSIHATINLDDPDDECDLDYVPHESRQTSLNLVLSNSFGFGGTNGTLVFRRV
ncbi:MAG: beta-ketoacyl-ACP synthase II [Gammaproteobacteria bacterium]|nr:beta-ketoacyl-ACP synthase II [Gammaproteobacteria bacterium]